MRGEGERRIGGIRCLQRFWLACRGTASSSRACCPSELHQAFTRSGDMAWSTSLLHILHLHPLFDFFLLSWKLYIISAYTYMCKALDNKYTPHCIAHCIFCLFGYKPQPRGQSREDETVTEPGCSAPDAMKPLPRGCQGEQLMVGVLDDDRRTPVEW